MDKAAFGSNSCCAVQAWPDQARGAALPNEPPTPESDAQISILRLHHGSLLPPSSLKSIAAANHFRLDGILARDPAHNQYP